MDGILLADKPSGKTSHDVVAEVRRERGERRVGHAGTLDPAATGLLILGLGRGTRFLEFLEDLDKEYVADVRLGVATDTGDAEGKVLSEKPVDLTQATVERAAERFVGEIVQRPPIFSAIKVKGRRAYDYARAGEEVELPEHRVRVHEFVLVSFEPPIARFRVRCSKGTYVRALARDLGDALGCGGSLSALRRTAVGPFQVQQAGRLLPVDAAVSHFPEVTLNESDTRLFLNGGVIARTGPGKRVRVYGGGRFLGVAAQVSDVLKPVKVLTE